jgi:hypothetical protein
MQAQLEKAHNTGGEPVLFWSGFILLLVLLGFVVLPSLNLGFVADDFFLLVPDQKASLVESPDELHRPLRNAVLKIAERQLGIQQVLPYRLLVAGAFAAALALLFQLTLRLGANRIAALAAVFVIAFFPRNQEVLYWFAAWQDLVAAAAVLLACLLFLDFRETGRAPSLAAAAIAYLIALGFKETTVVLPALLVTLDLYRERSITPFSRRPFWNAYLPFACILLGYVVYFLSQSGLSSLAGRRTGGYYGFHGLAGVFDGIVRALINIALPFSLPLGLKNVQPWHVGVLLIEAVGLLLLVWRLQVWPALTLTASWLILTILPTAAFAAAFNADRYLFVPMIGGALFVGLFVNALILSPKARRYAILAFLALALYTWAGVSQLVSRRELWRKAGTEAAMVIRETVRLCSMLPGGSEVDVINVTHSLYPRVQVLANGLSEALHANGFSPSARILRNFSAPDSEQQRLVAELLRCGNPAVEAPRTRTILMQEGGQILKLDTACASGIVDSDRAMRPSAWGLLYAGQ